MTKKHNILMEIFACALFSICAILLSSNQTFAVERQKTGFSIKTTARWS